MGVVACVGLGWHRRRQTSVCRRHRIAPAKQIPVEPMRSCGFASQTSVMNGPPPSSVARCIFEGNSSNCSFARAAQNSPRPSRRCRFVQERATHYFCGLPRQRGVLIGFKLVSCGTIPQSQGVPPPAFHKHREYPARRCSDTAPASPALPAARRGTHSLRPCSPADSDLSDR